MALQYGVALRTAQMAAIETTIGVSPKLELRTGAPPANAGAADTGTLLVSLSVPADFLTTASGGAVGIASGPWTGTAGAGAAGGLVAGHFRLKDNAASVTHIQGTVSLTGAGGDLTMDNTNIAQNQAVNVTSFAITAANA